MPETTGSSIPTPRARAPSERPHFSPTPIPQNQLFSSFRTFQPKEFLCTFESVRPSAQRPNTLAFALCVRKQSLDQRPISPFWSQIRETAPTETREHPNEAMFLVDRIKTQPAAKTDRRTIFAHASNWRPKESDRVLRPALDRRHLYAIASAGSRHRDIAVQTDPIVAKTPLEVPSERRVAENRLDSNFAENSVLSKNSIVESATGDNRISSSPDSVPKSADSDFRPNSDSVPKPADKPNPSASIPLSAEKANPLPRPLPHHLIGNAKSPIPEYLRPRRKSSAPCFSIGDYFPKLSTASLPHYPECPPSTSAMAAADAESPLSPPLPLVTLQEPLPITDHIPLRKKGSQMFDYQTRTWVNTNKKLNGFLAKRDPSPTKPAANGYIPTPPASEHENSTAIEVPEPDDGVPKTMKAAVIEEWGGDIQIKTVPVPEIGDEDILVKILYSGVCHTDLHVWKNELPLEGKPCPIVGGHEGAGIVVRVGANVKNFKVGDRAGLKWMNTCCLNCEMCKQGFEPNCPYGGYTGFTCDGTFRQYAACRASEAAPIPSNVELISVAPILCAGVTIYKGLKEARVLPGQIIAITGAGGGLGSLGIQYARNLGMRILAIDHPSKELHCRTLGAEFFVNGFQDEKALVQQIIDLTQGGAHGVVNVAPVPRLMDLSCEFVRKRGTVVLVGLPKNGYVKMHIFMTCFRTINVRGTNVGNRHDVDEAVDFFARGLVKIPIELQPLSQLQNSLERMERGEVNGRVVIDMWQ